MGWQVAGPGAVSHAYKPANLKREGFPVSPILRDVKKK